MEKLPELDLDLSGIFFLITILKY